MQHIYQQQGLLEQQQEVNMVLHDHSVYEHLLKH